MQILCNKNYTICHEDKQQLFIILKYLHHMQKKNIFDKCAIISQILFYIWIHKEYNQMKIYKFLMWLTEMKNKWFLFKISTLYEIDQALQNLFEPQQKKKRKCKIPEIILLHKTFLFKALKKGRGGNATFDMAVHTWGVLVNTVHNRFYCSTALVTVLKWISWLCDAVYLKIHSV